MVPFLRPKRKFRVMAIPRQAVLKVMFGLMVVAVAIVALLANPDRYRRQMIAYLENKTGRQIEIGHLGMSLFPSLSLRLSDFGWKNPPPFPAGYVVKAPVVDAQVDVHALLRGRIAIKLLVLTDPVINIIDDPDCNLGDSLGPGGCTGGRLDMPRPGSSGGGWGCARAVGP